MANALFRASIAPDRFPVPLKLQYAHLLYETGWPPNVLDEMDWEDIRLFLLYKKLRADMESGS